MVFKIVFGISSGRVREDERKDGLVEGERVNFLFRAREGSLIGGLAHDFAETLPTRGESLTPKGYIICTCSLRIEWTYEDGSLVTGGGIFLSCQT